MEYQEFLKQKKQLSGNFGFKPISIPDILFDFQKFTVEKALLKGRIALYLDTGLGKTMIQLSIADNIVKKTNGKVLILTPLAVAFQFIKEYELVGETSISYSKDGSLKTDIIITNYERLDKFNPSDFEAVLLDESSILKNFDGEIKKKINTFIRKVKYRFLSTATPSPNDFIELGTSSEALGYLGYTDMLTKFFKNNEDTIRPQNIGTKWILKQHAIDDFFEWVSSWSLSCRKPSDLGNFDDTKYVLPKLNLNYHSIENPHNLIINGQIQLFNQIARTLPEIRVEQKQTVSLRCSKAVEIAEKKDISVYWVNRNDEGDLIEKMDKDSVQIKGSMPLDKKEDILINFSNGQINKLITKAKMTGFGLNWQHCDHTVFFPTFSYEQYYQAIRRFWRFGQKKDVTVDLVFSDGQKRVLDSLIAKTKKADELYTKLNETLNEGFNIKESEFNKDIQLPKFI
jgi:ERCC4-related helicase